MEDAEIVALYWRRDESAIRETEGKYGRFLEKIAYNILSDRLDSEESVNDTYFKAWGSIPPHRPDVLGAFLAKIVRELSIDRWRARSREKRRASEYALSLEELGDCVSGGDATQEQADLRALGEAISAYLRGLTPQARTAFVGRYFYADSVREVAAYGGMSESKAKSQLYRTRQGLKAYLEQEGFL